MRTFPECYDCLIQQALSAMNSAEVDQKTQAQIIKKVMNTIEKADDSLSPPELASQTNRIVRESVEIDDLYQELKSKSHHIAMEHLGNLRDLSKQGRDKLEQGLKISAAGNMVDILHAREYHLWHEVDAAIRQELLGGSVEAFRKRITESPYLLYLADNVGETIFDRVFIETLDIPVIYAVKGGAIINDATLEDALAAGIDQVAKIIETGSRGPGTILNQCSEEFQNLFEKSDVILAKGQANYETLDSQGDKVFFLLRVKCPIISREIMYSIGSMVLKQGAPLN
ncbi:MAG: DUF89 family protein [Anaerolineales bacterium]|nr:DUF89 family protein [Anaerolineales bacterium]